MTGRRFVQVSARTNAFAIAAVLAACAACKKPDAAYEHASEHPHGHDHHAEDHGHEEPTLRSTLWSDRYELFVEHSSAAVGHEVELIVHVTSIDGWKPLAAGNVKLTLEGPSAVTATSDSPERAGIFRMTFTPAHAGEYRGRFEIAGAGSGATTGTVHGLKLTVHATEAAAHQAVPPEHEGAPIEFLKEQQWSIAFATALPEKRSIAAAVEVTGAVQTPPDGSAEVGAQVAGSVIAPHEGLPRPGAAVRKGQLLALLAPSPTAPEDAARATLAVAEAEARSAAAQAALARTERLLADQAASQRELDDARREAGLAQEAVRTARQAVELFAGATGKGSGSWRLQAPIAGTLVSVDATPGAAVLAGHVLFRIVDTRELWIRARIPEQDAAQLRAERGARYLAPGSETFRALGAPINGIGKTVDVDSRTVDVIYPVLEPDQALRVGGLVDISIPVGEEFTGLLVPRRAIVDQDGRDTVYVQLDGEHFVARPVRTGARAGEWVAIVDGLAPDERVVTRGAHFVRLADRPKGSEPHGHIH